MSAPGRAALIAAYRAALDIAEADPSLPLPHLRDYQAAVEFTVFGEKAPRQLAALEAGFTSAGAGPFTGEVETGTSGSEWWVSTGDLGGVPVVIRAPAKNVAERKVVGMVEKVEWVRHPAQDEARS